MGRLSSEGKRVRGSAGVAMRKRRLSLFPICAECKKRGVIKATQVIDHVIPLGVGGEDLDSNCQGLCHDHHAEKTALEGNIFAAANHPDWLQPSSIPLTVVTGPPASGKTTYVNERAGPFDTIICLDSIMMEIRPSYQHWSCALDPIMFNKAVRLRNARLNNLTTATRGRAWFIVSAPTQAERDWWHGRLGGELVHLHPGIEECKRRALDRGTPNAIAGIDAWDKASRSPWVPPNTRKAKQKFGEDGWPIDD